MTPAEEARFIALWTAGTETAAIAQALGIPLGTVKSRAHTLARQGKLQPRPRGGASPGARRWPGRRIHLHPTPPAAERKDIPQWTVQWSKALIEHLKAVAYERRIPLSQLVEELVWKSLMDHHPSTPSSASTPDRTPSENL